MASKKKSTSKSSRGPARSSRRSSQKESLGASELLVQELQEIHSAETQLSRVLPKFVKAAESEKFGEFLELRQQQGERLIGEIEEILETLDETPGRKKNVAAQGLIDDAREHIQEIEAGPALDAVLIGALQKTEHYCIAAWGTARALGEALSQKEVVTSMDRALKEGGNLDKELTALAESEVTPALLASSEDEEDTEDDDEDEE